MNNTIDNLIDMDEQNIETPNDPALEDDEFNVDDQINMEDESDLATPDLDLNLEVENTSVNSAVLDPKLIEMKLVCEVGHINISLDKLLSLKINDVIEVASWPQAVKLSCNGKHFAEGYLVDVNGLLGVKISKSYSL